MATYDLTQVELSALLTGNIDPSVRDFVLNYLFDLPAQPVDATQALNLAAGVSNFKV